MFPVVFTLQTHVSVGVEGFESKHFPLQRFTLSCCLTLLVCERPLKKKKSIPPVKLKESFGGFNKMSPHLLQSASGGTDGKSRPRQDC